MGVTLVIDPLIAMLDAGDVEGLTNGSPMVSSSARSRTVAQTIHQKAGAHSSGSQEQEPNTTLAKNLQPIKQGMKNLPVLLPPPTRALLLKDPITPDARQLVTSVPAEVRSRCCN
jgi:predicted component of type VI protein secretion system